MGAHGAQRMGAKIIMETTHPTMSETQEMVTTLATEACISLFDAYGVAVKPCDDSRTDDEEIAMTGVIGFTGPGIWGMCFPMVRAKTACAIASTAPAWNSSRRNSPKVKDGSGGLIGPAPLPHPLSLC